VEKLATEALEAASEEILEIFKRKYVEKYIYNSHGKNSIYHAGSGKPSYEFRDAWRFTELRKQLNIISTELWYNPGRLEFDMDTFKHGSLYSTPPDSRASLMDILNKSGYSSSLWLSVSRSVPYWDKFLEDAFSGGLLNKVITKHFTSRGFVKV
jgi:hypothetical protein